MKHIALSLLLAGTFLAQVANAQSSSTPVIGYYKFNVPIGTSVWVSGFVTKKDFQGAATSMTNGAVTSVINQTGAAWTVNQFNLHYVEIISGPKAGTILDIVSNTASSLTVEGSTTGFGLTGTETYAIRKHATFGKLFAAGGGLTAFEDIIALENSDGTQTVAYFDGTNWVDAISSANADNVIVYPGQGITVIATGNRVVTFGGGEVSYVKSGPTKIPVYAAAVNYIGVINPLVDTIAPTAADRTTTVAYGLKTELDPFNDVAATFTRDGLFDNPHVFYTDGTDIVDAITSLNGNAETIFNGSAIQVIPTVDRIYTLPQTHP